MNNTFRAARWILRNKENDYQHTEGSDESIVIIIVSILIICWIFSKVSRWLNDE